MIPRCGSSSPRKEFPLRKWNACFNPLRKRTSMRDDAKANAGRSFDEEAEKLLVSWLPTLLQTTDALFPTGAYAHSLGFEELMRLCGVRDEAGLREMVDAHVLPVLM